MLMQNNMLCLTLLLATQFSSGSARPNFLRRQLETVACTEVQCENRFQSMKAAGVLTGYYYSNSNIPNKGCFIKGDSMFFGTGGTDAEMNESDLGGEMKTRVWCDAATIAFSVLDESSSSGETRDASSTEEAQDNGGSCLTEEQCEEKFTLMRNAKVIDGNFYASSEYPTKGCFIKGSNVFFGSGGTDKEMTQSDLPEEQARLLCDGTSDEPKTLAQTKRSIYVITGAVVGSVVLLSIGIFGLKRYKRKG